MNSGGSASTASRATGKVLPGAPASSSPPTFSGPAQQGQTLSATNGRWRNHPTSYSHRWQTSADGSTWSNLPDATGSTYKVQPADVGSYLRIRVKASNAGGSSSPAASMSTARVLPLPPIANAPPTISGAAQELQTLTATNGRWQNNPTFSYQWQTSGDGRAWSDIPGATALVYQVANVESYLRFQVTASNAAGSAKASSAAIALVPPTRTQVTMSPALTPSFDPAITDYVTRCDGADAPQVGVETASGDTVSVDGGAPQRGFFADRVALGFNQEFSFSVTSQAGTSSTYYVRCLPSDFPQYTFTVYSQPSQFGYLTAPDLGAGSVPYAIMFDNQGVPIWWYKSTTTWFNATLMPDGTIAWWVFPGYNFYNLDGTVTGSTGTVGYTTDGHEIQQDSDGNYDMVASPVVDHVDLSSIGGPSDAQVTDCIAQIVSSSGTLVWSWDALQHIPVTEFNNPSLTGPPYDVYHCNSMQVTPTTVLISFRALDAIFLIDRATGDVIWKLGGTPTAQSLTVSGDTRSVHSDGQHDARLTSGGLLSFFDDGTFWNDGPPRGVSFQIDPVAMTATYVNQVTDSTVPYSLCCGSSRILDNGNWLIGWGFSSTIGEYTAQGDPVFRLVWSPNSVFSYRTVPVPNGVYTMAEVRAGMNTMHPRP